MSPSLAECVKSLSSCGLMSDDEVKRFVEGLPPEKRPGDFASLLGRLVDENRLTPYQAEALLLDDSQPLLLGDHVVLERLGAGGMGVVYKAWNRRMDRIVAVKTLPVDKTRSSDAVQRFYREVKAAARLSHPNIVATYHADEQDSTPYLVMEFVDGVDLLRLVRRHGPLPVALAINLIAQAAEGLQYAHSRGVIHRDVKPSNLLVDKEGTVKILDLGLARIAAAAGHDFGDLTNAGDVMGTIGYLAPEQAGDPQSVDHRCDIYSLGCTLYFLLMGTTLNARNSLEPAHASDGAAIPLPAEKCPALPDDLQNVFQKMVARRPDDRYASMTEVCTALAPYRRDVDENDFSTVWLVSDLVAKSSDAKQPSSTVRSAARSTDRPSTAKPSPQPPQPRAANRSSRLRWIAAGGLVLTLLLGSWLALLATRRQSADDELPLVESTEFSPQQAARYQKETARFLDSESELTNSIGMQFMLIPAHRAQEMQDGGVVHPFYLGAHEVTQDDYLKVMGDNPSAFRKGGREQQRVADVLDTSRLPVESVSWQEARAFCRRLSEMREESQAGRVYRLPTGREWQFACRAGDAADMSAASEATLTKYAWYQTNSQGRTHAVGLLQPNAFGLYDMFGNVEEWAADEYYGRQLTVGAPFWKWGPAQTATSQNWVGGPLHQSDQGFRVVCETPETRKQKALHMPAKPEDNEAR